MQIDLFCDDCLDWRGLFFSKKSEFGLHIFSGGRFGFLGFNSIKKKIPLSLYLDYITSALRTLNVSTASLALSFREEKVQFEETENWSTSNLKYFVADTEKSVKNQKLIFKKTKRKQIRKMLDHAYNFNIRSTIAKSIQELRLWYFNCHLKRMNELNG